MHDKAREAELMKGFVKLDLNMFIVSTNSHFMQNEKKISVLFACHRRDKEFTMSHADSDLN